MKAESSNRKKIMLNHEIKILEAICTDNIIILLIVQAQLPPLFSSRIGSKAF